MDIPRKSFAHKKRACLILYGLAGLGVMVLTTLGLARLKPAPPVVEAGAVWRDVVKRGSMMREVRGVGTLVPETLVWVPAPVDGRIVKQDLWPGTQVRPDTVLLEMSNLVLDQALADTEYQLKA